MATEIKLLENQSLIVRDEYREVYEKLLATAWSNPCEFELEGDAGDRRVTINPSYVVCFHTAEVDEQGG